MKKRLLCLAMGMAMMLGACGSSGEAAATSEAPESKVESTVEETSVSVEESLKESVIEPAEESKKEEKEKEKKEKEEEKKKEEQESKAESEEQVQKPAKDGFDKKTNTVYQLAEFNVPVPAYFGEPMDGATATSGQFAAETGETLAVLGLSVAELPKGEDLKNEKQSYQDSIMSGFDSYEIVTEADGEVAGLYAYQFLAQTEANGIPIYIAMTGVYNPDSGSLLSVGLYESANSKYEYAEDVGKILKAITINEEAIDDGIIDFEGTGYHVTYDHYEISEDYSGNPCLFYYYTFTNTGNSNTMPMTKVHVQCFQGGTECDTTVAFSGADEVTNSMKELQPGASLLVCEVFKLKEAAGDIEIDASDLISLSEEKDVQIISLGGEPSYEQNSSSGSGETDKKGNATFTGKDYSVTYTKAELGKDYEGNPALYYYYTFSNDGDKNQTAGYTVSITCFQNGVECDKTVTMDNLDAQDNLVSEIQPGHSIEVCEVYKLQDTTSDVTVEISGLFSFGGDTVTQTITLK